MRNLPRLVPLAAALAAAFACNAETLPQGGVLRDGQASVVRTSASRIDVLQTSDRAVLDWQSFSIGAGGRVNIQQPSASSSILNRVVGTDPSLILGHLTANGMVFLVNPNGIVFGQSARIDVGSLVASTANISTENFMAGHYLLDDVVNRHATIVNEGLISAADGGLVALIAPGVANSGTLRANLGRVVLASGNAFTLDLFGDQLIALAVDDKVTARLTDLEGRPLRAYVDQAGVIEAQSVLITANAAKGVLDNVINLSGVVRASGVSRRGGEIVLHGDDINVAGTLDASGGAGQSGGRVSVTGGTVSVAASGRIDVSGASGGQAIIVADDHLKFDGNVNARGAGGPGGFVEISGMKTLDYGGTVDLSAGGSLLFDPIELDINAAMAATLSSTLQSGANAMASTTTNDLVVSSMIDGRGGVAGGGLTLTAGGTGSILVNADILTNAGAVNMTAGGAITMGTSGTVLPGSTLIHTGSGGSINLNAGGMLIAGRLVSGGGVTLAGSSIIVDRTINAGGAVTFNAGVGGTEFRHSVFTTSGDITVNGIGKLNPAGDEIGFNTTAGVTGTEVPMSAAELDASGLAPGRTASCAAGATGCTGGNPLVDWDAITVKITIKTDNGNIAFNNGLIWSGASPANSMKWFHGEPDGTARSALTSAPVRFYAANLVTGNAGTVTLSGTIGYAVTHATNLANPGHPLVNDLMPTPDNTFKLLISTAPGGTLSGATATGKVDGLSFNGTNFDGTNGVAMGIPGIASLGSGSSTHPSGQLIPPSPTSANVGSGATYLSEISLPTAPVVSLPSPAPVDVAAATSGATTPLLVVDLEQPDAMETGGRGAAASADLGRGGASSGAAADVFDQGFYLVDARAVGPNADQGYFTDTPFQAAERRRRSQ